MKLLYRLLLSSTLVLAAGCSAPEAAPLPAPEATPGVSGAGSSVETRRAAAAAGRQLLEEKGGIHWIEAPRAVLIEEMSYAEAQELVGLGEPDYDLWPQETRVWFVIFNGRWELTPLDPAQADPQPVAYEGCLLLVFTASDASLISMGDSVCPST